MSWVQKSRHACLSQFLRQILAPKHLGNQRYLDFQANVLNTISRAQDSTIKLKSCSCKMWGKFLCLWSDYEVLLNPTTRGRGLRNSWFFPGQFVNLPGQTDYLPSQIVNHPNHIVYLLDQIIYLKILMLTIWQRNPDYIVNLSGHCLTTWRD